MKKYIIMTCNIHSLGGTQAYTASKTNYLESLGWKVVILFYGSREKGCPIKALDKYVDGGYPLSITPWTMSKINKDLLLKCIIKEHSLMSEKSNDEIIIESHDSFTAPWGELLAKRLNAKHITVLLNEIYDGPQRHYQEKLDFYRFKLQRRELPFSPKRAGLLFHDESLAEEYETRYFEIDEDPVQDIDSPIISSITHNDWNIGYIGRASKGYLPNIIDGVCEFAKKHIDHNIQFVIIGDFTCRKEYFDEKYAGISNLKLVELGDQYPLPRCYFDKVDVVIAGSGSARCAIYEGKLTLVADANNYLCNGLLGYDTKNSVRGDADTVQMNFAEGLERALVLKTYNKMNYDFPPKPGVAECVKQNFEFIATSDQRKEYYSEKELCKGKKKSLGIITFVKLFFTMLFPKNFQAKNDKKENKK